VIKVNKKIKLLFLIMVVSAALISAAVAQEGEFKRINALNYHKSMFSAQQPTELLRIPLGSGRSEVGGGEQDPEVYTEGVPFAFRPVENGKVWVLDSANQALKLFAADGSVMRNFSLKEYGKIVRDFALDGEHGFWLLSPIEGFIYRLNEKGEEVSKIEGFFDARAIESSVRGDLLVDMPMLASVLRFGSDELLRDQLPYGNGLSLVEGTGGKLLGLEVSEKNVKLNLRSVASPSQDITLAEFPLLIKDEAVKYAGAEILGKDASGNLYLNLIACHDQGPIYQDRLLKCTILGKILAQTDILTVPCLTPDLPRTRVVTPDGNVMTFYLKGNDYVLAVYKI
jgi:hypothetical protein